MKDQEKENKNQIEKRIREIRDRSIRAPEFPTNFKWLNTSRPLSIKSLKGRMVLLDFWTYCCINCMHVLPDLKYLEQKYIDQPFTVIGVHSAKFDNETEVDNVRNAILRYEIEHPVILDDGHQIWSTFGVRAWPTLVLIDPDGYLIGMFPGEGNRDALDWAIETSLEYYRQAGKLDNSPLKLDLEKEFVKPSLLNYPGKIIAQPDSGRLIISDSNHHRFLVVDETGKIIEVIGNGDSGFDDGTFEEATFFRPQGMAFHHDTLYVADTENHAIRRINFTTRKVETVAGTGIQADHFNRGGEGKSTALNSPWDLYIQGDTCYIAMAGLHQIWTLDLKSYRVAPYAGSGREARIDGDRATAAFAQPSGITGDGENLYIADSEISSVRQINLKTGQVSTLVGGDLFAFGDKDGRGDDVRLQHPLGIFFHENVLYLADTYNHKIKTIDPKTQTAKAFAGSGQGYRDGEKPQFYEPSGLTVLNGKLYIADTNNHLIRILDLKKGNVETLDIRGLEKIESGPKVESTDEWLLLADAPTIELPVQKLKPDQTIQLMVKIELKSGQKFNPGSPLKYFITIEVPLIDYKSPNNIQVVDIPTNDILIPVQTRSNTGEGAFTLDLLYYYCEDAAQSLCYIRSVRYVIPFEIVPDGADKILIIENPAVD
ncbi:redoxin domain-containing protein [candidate division KSB1 bacterium]|nr:redoxin domain-containing protein [candidate division KSB1 bacterium]